MRWLGVGSVALFGLLATACATAKMEIRTRTEALGTAGQRLDALAGTPVLSQRRLQFNPTLRTEEEVSVAGGVYPPQLLTPRVLGPWHFYTFGIGTKNIGDFFCYDAKLRQFQIWMDSLGVCDTGRASKQGVAVSQAEVLDPTQQQLVRELIFVGVREEAAHFICKEQYTARDQDVVANEIIHPLNSSGDIECGNAQIRLIAASNDKATYEVVRGFADER
jgi:hypothetical protein